MGNFDLFMYQEKKKVHAFKSLCPLTCLNVPQWTGCTVNFKQRYGQYIHSFTHINANHTCLCNHVWKLKSSVPPIPYHLVWDIVARAAPYNPATGYCDLCTEEKYRIMFEPQGASLNQRSQFFAYCYHERPQLLINFRKKKI